MPLPLPVAAYWGGPAAAAAAAAAKVIAFEYLPAISSASLAALLAQSAWKRIPAWIKDDVSFSSTSSSSELASVLEKIQAWMEGNSEKLTDPVPHVYASLLLYWQLCSCYEVLEEEEEEEDEPSREASEQPVDLVTLKQMLDLATWAYDLENCKDRLASVGYEWKSSFSPTRPGSVGYYVAESETVLLIGIKGTSSLEELLTDACGRSVSYSTAADTPQEIEVQAQREDRVVVSNREEEEVEIVSGHERICIEQQEESHSSHVRCHEGILLSTQRLLTQIQATVEERVVRGPLRLVLVGHSLGASAACLLALLLRSEYHYLLKAETLHVYAFAPPPVLDHDSAIAAASYVTSVVNQSDFVARCSTANLAVLLEVLRTLSTQVLLPQTLAPVGPRSTARLLNQLQNGKPVWTRQQLAQAVQEAHDKVELRHPDHLYVPGKLYLLQQLKKKYTCNLTNVTAPSLRLLKLNGFKMLGDHTMVEYHAVMDALLYNTRTAAENI
jgi:hypothetical protein